MVGLRKLFLKMSYLISLCSSDVRKGFMSWSRNDIFAKRFPIKFGFSGFPEFRWFV